MGSLTCCTADSGGHGFLFRHRFDKVHVRLRRYPTWSDEALWQTGLKAQSLGSFCWFYTSSLVCRYWSSKMRSGLKVETLWRRERAPMSTSVKTWIWMHSWYLVGLDLLVCPVRCGPVKLGWHCTQSGHLDKLTHPLLYITVQWVVFSRDLYSLDTSSGGVSQ